MRIERENKQKKKRKGGKADKEETGEDVKLDEENRNYNKLVFVDGKGEDNAVQQWRETVTGKKKTLCSITTLHNTLKCSDNTNIKSHTLLSWIIVGIMESLVVSVMEISMLQRSHKALRRVEVAEMANDSTDHVL